MFKRKLFFTAKIILIISSISLSTNAQSILKVPNDYPTIQNAIDAASNGDTVLVNSGTYTENINFNGKDIIVGSYFIVSNDTSYISSTIIDGQQQGSVCTFENNETNNAKLIGFTLQKGSGKVGVWTTSGGGVFIRNASPTLSNLIIKNNSVYGRGGGVFIGEPGTDPILIDLKISKNSSADGGGIHIEQGAAEFKNIFVFDNTASGYGGGLKIEACTNLKVNNIIVANNNGGNGGGIFFHQGRNVLNNITIVNNVSNYDGGVSFGGDPTEVIFLNSIIYSADKNEVNLWSNPLTKISFYNSLVTGGLSSIKKGHPDQSIVWENSISDNPRFLNINEGDYSLSDYSTAIGSGISSIEISGTTYNSEAIDVLNSQRPIPIGSNPDIGAIENDLGIPLHNSQIYVSKTGDDEGSVGLLSAPFKSIQSAIDYAISGDTILVGAGTYVENVSFLGKDIHLRSLQGPSETVLKPFIESQAIVWIKSGETRNAILNGFTLTEGGDVRGSAINIQGANPTIKNCIITNNRGEGAINCYIAQPVFINCIISKSDNRTFFFDAAGYTEILNCTIVDNKYRGLENIYMGYAPKVTNSIISNNGIGGVKGNFSITYSIVEGNYPGEGNLDCDPNFTNSLNADYHLSDFSPAIGAGTSANYPFEDLSNSTRPNPIGSDPDLGAYESPLAHFNLLQPVLLSPDSNSLNQTLNTKLSWNHVYGATEYRLQVSEDSTFATTKYDEVNITDTSYTISLEYYTKYFWRVNASYPYDTSAWSNTWKFKTIIEKPERPNLVSPSDQSINRPNELTINWKKAERAEYYNVFYATNSGFSENMFVDSLIADTTLTITNLNYNTDYYWKVEAVNIGGRDTSITWRFRTELENPTLVYPANKSTNILTQTELKWKSVEGAQHYYLKIAEDSLFTNIIISDSSITDTLFSVDSLEHEKKHYWQVKAISDNYTSQFSPTFSFTTIVRNPEIPTLLAPLNNSIDQPLSISLSWNEVAKATSYLVEVSSDSLFNTIVFVDSSVVTTSKEVDLPKYNQRYYWRIKAINIGGSSEFSDYWNFTTLLPPPELTSINSGNKTVSITWTQDVTNNLVGFNIYRDTKHGADIFLMALTDTLRQFIDTSLVNDSTYFYRLKALSNYGFESSFSNELSTQTFNIPPQAAELSDVILHNEGRTLTKQLSFNGESSSDSDGAIETYSWFVNDTLITNNSSLTYDFPQGTYAVKLIVKDNDGATDSSFATVTRTAFQKQVNGEVLAGLSIIGENQLYAIVSGDAVYKLDKDGNTDYTLSVNGDLLSSSSIANDSTVYIGSTDNNLYAFSKNATSLWFKPLGGAVTATPTIDFENDRLYVGVSNRNFQFLDRNTGDVLGNYFSDAPINTSAVITGDNKLFFSTTKGTMYGFDLNDLSLSNITPDWVISSTDTITTSPAIDEDGYFYVGTKNGFLKKISMIEGEQGNIVWQSNLGGSIDASPVIDKEGYIYVGTTNGQFYSINKSDGSTNWLKNVNSGVHSTAAISNLSNIYFGTENGVVYCIDSTGNALWNYVDSSLVSSSMLYSEGTLFFGTQSGKIIAIYDSDVFTNQPIRSSATRNIWATFQGNNQRTGSQEKRIFSSFVKFIDGWNMLSIPYNSDDMSKLSLFPNSISSAFYFDNGYKVKDSLTTLVGYWLKFSNPDSVKINGTKVLNGSIQVKTGWNLIGSLDYELLTTQIDSYPSGIITSNFFEFNNGYKIPEKLLPGKGYWIKSNSDGYLYDNPSRVKKDGKPDLKNSAKLIITDNANCRMTLFIDKNNELGDLPPVPPDGIFDVRFSNNKFIREEGDLGTYLEINYANYPIKIHVEGSDFRIRDMIDGSMLNMLLKDGEEILLNENNINKLQIEPIELPASFILYQNYPNPFNPSTTIKYGIPRDSKVKIELYNSIGQRVRTVLNKEIEAGYHEIKLNANELASGVYFYRIHAGDFIDTKKLILLK